MKQSRLFSKTRKEAPSDEAAKNAKLLIRAGFIHKEMAGVYSYLPLGLRVLNKVNNIIREEMNRIGGEEILLTSLQDKDAWQKSGRWSDEAVDNWFKTSFKSGGEVGLAFTHEEPLTNLMREHIHSFRDLPAYVYQIQTKFRNEARAKSGLMRCREFLMKDLYSFSRTNEEHETFYEKAKEAYLKVYDRVGLGERTYVTFAAGGTFSKYSHEFQTLTEAGEDTIYVDHTKKLAVNKEVYDDQVLEDIGLNKGDLKEEKSVEVGNIFSLGTKFSDALQLSYVDENGEKKPVIMGSYGIGPGRLIGTVVESLSDEKGIVWPKSIAPFDVHLIEINPKRDAAVSAEAQRVYELLTAKGVEVLWDERDASAGEKFADSDLIGIPVRYVVSAKTLADKSIEQKVRATQKTDMISASSI
jgi:prolyl-tRNA synthetase